MSYQIANVRTDQPANDGVIIYWLAASGFVFKFASGDILCIDPYLSDYVEDIVGFIRLSLAPIDAANLHFDHLLITHDHGDHLDVGCFEELMAANPNSKILASLSCSEYLNSHNHAFTAANFGDHYKAGAVDVKIIKADHGDQCDTALGFLITYGKHRIFFTGDTCINDEAMAPAIETSPTIVIPCINGEFGNLTETDAAEIVKQCNAEVAIPSHFGLSAEHGGSPANFQKAVAALSPNTRVQLLKPGRGIEIV